MNQEEMLLIKKFIKNYNLPISVLPKSIFEHRLCLLDSFYNGIINKWLLFNDTVKTLGGIGKYLELHNEVYEKAIESVQKSPGYESFNRVDIPDRCEIDSELQRRNVSKHDIYRDPFLGHIFVSLDMKKAGFSVLHAFDPEIFSGKDTYEDWLRMFTDLEVLLESKSLRQAILGNCNPKRQGRMESIWMKDLLVRMANESPMVLDLLVCINKDELIFDLDLANEEQKGLFKDFCQDVANSIPDDEPQLRCEVFVLKDAYFRGDDQRPHSVGYLKRFEDGQRELKAVNQVFVPFVIRTLEADKHNASTVYNRKDTIFVNENGMGHYTSLRVGDEFVEI